MGTKRCSPEAQELIDILMPIAGARRINHGPNDPLLFLLGKIIHQLQMGEIEGRAPRKASTGKKKTKLVKAHLPNGARVSIPAEMLEKEV